MKRLSLFLGIFFHLLLLPTPGLSATVSLPVYNDTDADRTDYVFFGGVPLSYRQSTSEISDLMITMDEEGLHPVPAQFDVISRYDDEGDGWQGNDRIRTVLCTFQATVQAGSNRVYYLQINPGGGNGGNAEGPKLSSEDGFHRIIDTGRLETRISKSAGTLFDRATIGGRQLINATPTDGLYLVSDAEGSTKTFVSHNSSPTEIKTIYNGPLFCLIEVSGELAEENDNTDKLIPMGGPPAAVNPVKYSLWYYTFKDHSTIYVNVRLKNENPGNCAAIHGTTNRNLAITSLHLRNTLNGMGAVTQVDFGGEWSDTTTPSGPYTLQQRHCLPGSCAQASEDDSLASPNFTYQVYQGAAAQLTPGPSSHNRFDSYAQMRDSLGGIMLAMEYHWQNWPLDIMFDATLKQAQIHLLPDVGDDHIFLGGAWKMWTTAYHFHDDGVGSENFEHELLSLKKPLKILLGNQIAQSEFYADRTFPHDLHLDITMEGGEELDLALEAWQDTIRAQHDNSFSQNRYKNFDMNDIRELRPVSSSEGAYNGPIDMYGWLRFGDWVRGHAAYGMGALNYAWNYIFILNGHRFGTYDMVKMGEQMSLKTVDSLMLHMAIDDNTTINGSGAMVKTMHGGHRGEMNTSTGVTNYVTSNNHDSLSNWKHGFPHGAIVEYMLTGKPWLAEGLTDLGDFIRFGYSQITPDHGLYTNDSDIRDCVTGDCSHWRADSAMRPFVRSMGAAIGLYQATGDVDYLQLAKGIFTNAVLGSEGKKDGKPQGYCDLTGNDPYLWGSTQSMKYSIMLYYLMSECKEISVRNQVRSYLSRMASWLETTFQSLTHQPGTYSGSTYMAHTGYYRWNDNPGPDYGWSGAVHNEYVFELADLFAFKYREISRDKKDLIRARQIFQDYWFYQQNNDYEPIRTSLLLLPHANNGPSAGAAWLKLGKTLNRPMYWAYTEWLEQQPDDPGSLAAPKGLSIIKK